MARFSTMSGATQSLVEIPSVLIIAPIRPTKSAGQTPLASSGEAAALNGTKEDVGLLPSDAVDVDAPAKSPPKPPPIKLAPFGWTIGQRIGN